MAITIKVPPVTLTSCGSLWSPPVRTNFLCSLGISFLQFQMDSGFKTPFHGKVKCSLHLTVDRLTDTQVCSQQKENVILLMWEIVADFLLIRCFILSLFTCVNCT